MSRAERLLTACAWCERVKVGAGWFNADAALHALRTFQWTEPPLFTHGICEDCLSSLATGQEAA